MNSTIRIKTSHYIITVLLLIISILFNFYQACNTKIEYKLTENIEKIEKLPPLPKTELEQYKELSYLKGL